MKITPRDLRIDPPRLDTPDHVIDQLSALAVAGAKKPTRRRGAILAGVTAGVVTLGMGGAWASGAVEVPGLPKPGRSAPVDPSQPEQPRPDTLAPTPTSTPSEGAVPPGAPANTPQPEQQGHAGKPGSKDAGAQDESTPPAGAGVDKGGNAPGQKEAEERRPDHAGKPESPGNSGGAGKSDDAGRPEETGKPAAPRDPQRDTSPKGRNPQPQRDGAATPQRSGNGSDRAGDPGSSPQAGDDG